jgi:Pyruvate/2-oxoacid:ferredoxin oxidoreductase gamma subunit
MHNIKLADGTELKDLELNGNNYISDTIIEDEVFKDNLDTVIISDEESSEEHHDMKLIKNKVCNGQSWFILAEKTEQEKEKDKMYNIIADLTETVLNGGV